MLDALSTPRSYREALSMDQAIQHLQGNAGILFDPEVVAAVVERRAEIEDIHAHYPARASGAA